MLSPRSHYALTAALAAAFAAAPALADPPPAPAWTPFADLDHGVGVTRADGTFGVAAHAFVWSRFDANLDAHGDGLDFRVPLVRPALRGNVARPWITYFIQAELAGAPRVLDAEVTVHPTPWFGARFGQFIPPFTRQFLVAPMRLLFPDFAASNTVFRIDRSRGLELFGQSPGGRFEWHAAVTDANTISATANELDHLRVYGRLAVTPWGRNAYTETPGVDGAPDFFSVGLNGTWATVNRPASNDPTAPNVGVGTDGFGLDLALHAGRVFAQAEGYLRSLGDARGDAVWSGGGYVEAGVTVIPQRFELAMRGDMTASNLSTGAGLTRRAEVLAAAYVAGNHLKAQLRWSLTDAEAGSPLALTGTSQQLTLQTQLFF